MDLIVQIVVQIALLAAGWKLWRWSRKKERANKTVWRRRFASIFFVSPMVFWLLSKMIPDNIVMDTVLYLSNNLDKGVDWLVGTLQDAARENAPGAIGVLAVKPAVRSVVYAILGALVGWPLDRRAAKKAAAQEKEKGEEEEEEEG